MRAPGIRYKNTPVREGFLLESEVVRWFSGERTLTHCTMGARVTCPHTVPTLGGQSGYQSGSHSNPNEGASVRDAHSLLLSQERWFPNWLRSRGEC